MDHSHHNKHNTTQTPGHHQHQQNTGHTMAMYFHPGTMVTIFFKDWMTMNESEYAGACIALFVLAFLFEGLKVLRQYVTVEQWEKQRNPAIVHVHNDKSFKKGDEEELKSTSMRVKILMHITQTLLHVLQIFLGYLAMLAFMTYNTLICVAILLGYGFGYLVFGWFRPSNRLYHQPINEADCCNL